MVNEVVNGRMKLGPMSLKANFSWMLLGGVYYNACQWGMLAVMARLGTPEMVGTYALALAVTAPVFMFTNLQLRAVQATDAADEYAFGDYLALRLVGSVAAVLFVCITIIVAKYDVQTALVVLIVALAKAIESISDVIFGLFQRFEHMRLIAFSWIIKGTLSLSAIAVILILTDSLSLGVAGVGIAWVLVLAGYDAANARRFASAVPRFRLPTMIALAKLSLPLGIVMMLISLNTNIPRYFIEQFAGRADLGIFAAMAYLMVAGNTITNSLGTSASPRLAKFYANGQRQLYCSLLIKLGAVGVGLGIVGVAGAWLVGQPVLNVLYGAEYAACSDVLVIVAIAFAVNCLASFCGYAMTSARFFAVQLPVFLVVVAMTIVCSLHFVPQFGLAGAAIVLVISGIVQLVISLAVILHILWRKWGREPFATQAPLFVRSKWL